MLNRFTRYAAGLMAMTCAALSPAHAEDTADQLMERNFFVTKVSAMRVQMTMQLIAPDSQKRERKPSSISPLPHSTSASRPSARTCSATWRRSIACP